MEQHTVAQILRNFVIDNFLYADRDTQLNDDDSFSDKGIVDSTGVLELITYVESEFGIRVSDEEIIPDNFDSLEKLTRYIQTKRSGNNHAA